MLNKFLPTFFKIFKKQVYIQDLKLRYMAVSADFFKKKKKERSVSSIQGLKIKYTNQIYCDAMTCLYLHRLLKYYQNK